MVSRAPYLLTLTNGLAGLLAIYFAFQSQPMVALLLILAGAVFDLGDGWLARKLGTSSDQGASADVVADMVSFGAAPAILVALGGEGLVSKGFALLYLLAIIFRLLRFRLKSPAPREFIGMPSPMTAIAVAAGVVVEQNWLPGSMLSEIVTLFFAIVAASRIPYPKWGHSCLKQLPKFFWILLWILHILAFFFLQAEAILSAMIVYLFIGPATLLRYRRHQAT